MKIGMRFGTIMLILMLFVTAFSPVAAYESTTREELKLDESLSSKENILYAYPEKILVTQVISPNADMESDSESWINLLYYYYITRLGFSDLPYNYLIDKSGRVYEGRSGFEGSVPELLEPQGAVLIGYLSNGSEITSAASESMIELLEKLSYQYGITQDEVSSVKLEVSDATSEGALSKLEYETVESLFAQELGEVLGNVTYSDTENLKFKASVTEVKYEDKAILGERFKVSFKLKNEGDSPWFTLNDFIYVKTANDEDSKFAINGVWDSFNTPYHVEGETVLPGAEVDVEFEMAANALPGEYSESFKFSRVGGKDLEGGEFKITFTIEKGDLQLIEITSTETGNLNVRKDPSLGAQVVGQVDIGTVFVVKEEQNGWYKVEFEPEELGWVWGRYVKRL